MGPSNAFRVLHDGTAELQKQGDSKNSVVIKETVDGLDNKISNLNNTIENDIKTQIDDLDTKVNEDITEAINELKEEMSGNIETAKSELKTYVDDKTPIVSDNQPETLAEGQIWLQPNAIADYSIWIGKVTSKSTSGILTNQTWTWYIDIKSSGRVEMHGSSATITINESKWSTSGGGVYATIGNIVFPKYIFGTTSIQLPGTLISLNSNIVSSTGNCWYWTASTASTGVSDSYAGRFTADEVIGRATIDVVGYLSESELNTIKSAI